MHESERNLDTVSNPLETKAHTAEENSNTGIELEPIPKSTENVGDPSSPLLSQDYGTFSAKPEDQDEQEVIQFKNSMELGSSERDSPGYDASLTSGYQDKKEMTAVDIMEEVNENSCSQKDSKTEIREMSEIQLEEKRYSDKKSIEEGPLIEEEKKPLPEKKEVDPHERDQSKVVVLPDGRSLAFSQYGDLTSREVILLIPPVEGVRVFGRWFDKAAKTAGCRLLCPDRPGFGFSHPLPSRGFKDFSYDIHILLSVLHIKKVIVIGHSAGSVYAAGFATAYPKSVKAVGLMAPWAPLNTSGFPVYCQCGHCLRCCTGQIAKTILQDHVAAFHAADTQLTEEEQEEKRQARIEAAKAARRALPCPKRCCKEMSYYIGYCCAWLRFFISWTCWYIQQHCCKKREPLEGESAVVQTKEYQDTNRAIVRELFRQGPASLSYELKLCMRRGSQRKLFGYSYSDIPHPVTVFVALHDKMTHPNVGRGIAASIPGAELVEFPDSSHIMFVQQEVTNTIVQTVLKSIPPDDHSEEWSQEEDEKRPMNSVAVRHLNGGGLRVSL